MSKQIFCGPGLYLPQEKPKPILPPFGSDKVYVERTGSIFVFGSNLAGVHGGGAAATALKKYGAVIGEGYGLQSGVGINGTKSWALPTKNEKLKSLTLTEIAYWVSELFHFCSNTYTDDYDGRMVFVTKVGCGLAGFTEQEIAPLFRRYDNANSGWSSGVILPTGWNYRRD